jgi:hypothetical protein
VRLPRKLTEPRLSVLAVAVATALATGAQPAAAQTGGGQAPDFDDPCPAIYPGDDASQQRIARWMAGGAAARGLPWELPVVAGLGESGLQNLRGQSYSGFFGMSRVLNEGDYRGFPKKPDLQLRWFLDTAAIVRQRRVAQGRPDPADDRDAFGIWVADIEQPAPENRSGYQKYLERATELVGTGCPAPVRDDSMPPTLRLRVASRQRALSAGGIALRVSCREEGCLAGAFGTVRANGRKLTMRTAAVDPEGGWAGLLLRVPRSARKQLARGRSLRARITGVVADEAANASSRARTVRLLP